MKKAICLILVALLALSTLGLPALAGDQGELGRLTKLNVDEDTLTQAIMESYMSVSLWQAVLADSPLLDIEPLWNAEQ